MKAKIGILGLVMSLLFIGCSKDDQTDGPMSEEDLTVNANMDEMSEDVSKVAQDVYLLASTAIGKSSGEIMAFLPECAQIGYSDSGNNWVRTVDFGVEGCALNNGNVLKGKVIVTGSYDFGKLPYTVTCTFENFYHNKYLVQGTKTLVRTMETTSNLESVHPVLTMTVNFKVTSLNGVVRNITGTRVREMVAGLDTPKLWMDDVFLISGNQSVTSPKGTITTTITSPLHVLMNCNHVVKGILEHTKNNNKATLDYGNGDCDNLAVLTLNGGLVKEITLGK